jgi:CheY-like chemotaxis protein
MPQPTPVAILGFSTFDRKALGACFKLTEPGRPRYEWVLSMEDAVLVIADADESGVLDLLRKLDRVGDTLFIGAQAPAGATASMMRPIDRAQVLRELNRLRAGRRHPDSAPMPLPLPASLGRPLRTIGSAPLRNPPSRRASDEQDVGSAGAPLRSALEALRRQREALRQPQIPTRVLLVDDSEVALHFLRRQLEAYGLDVDLARHSDRALDLLTHHAYGIVFLDVDLGEHSRSDGLTLCHQIRHRLLHPGGKPPMVVMVSAFRDPVDQVRGTLAGAEAYLGKPLDSQALDRLLQRQGFQRRLPPVIAPLRPLQRDPG